MERKNNTAPREPSALTSASGRAKETSHVGREVSQMRRRFTPVPLRREEPVSTPREPSSLGRRTTQPGFTALDPARGIATPKPRLALTCLPKRIVSDDALLGLPLDHRAGFVLGHIDGATTMHELIDICGMDQEEVAAILERLLALRVLALK